ncbi:MAG TPA: tRNA pseudouridine(55) synthase TruB [Dongiaceae bacterium]|jgi:tRNA pseudouridine55 synthase|nr:tRNA pseudouridine(55) synthase TruB [Dongiaceae bacterium]
MKGHKIDGWIALDKPAGISSAQAVAAVKRGLDARKVGHAGTLDPLATGILPIALGEATKTIPYLIEDAKEYRFTLRFGEERTTDDAEGEILRTSPVRPTDHAIGEALGHFTGDIQQVPPAYSAIKVAGKRAYSLARAGTQPVLEARRVHIDAIALEERPEPDQAILWVRCGKGTYIRALARDLARYLGTVGHATELRRLRVGPFTEALAISLDKLEQGGHSAGASHLLPVATALDDIPALALTGNEADRLRSGQTLGFFNRSQLGRISDLRPDMILKAMEGDRLVALVRFHAGEIRPLRVLHL